jgi:exonuclease I
MKKNFVRFLSPSTFCHEETTKPIESWDVGRAIEMASKIKERHGATPFAFQFVTRGRKKNELDSRVTATSGRYYLGGKVLTLEQIKCVVIV